MQLQPPQLDFAAFRDIAHLAEMPGGFLPTTFLVGGPQNPKDLGFGGFSPIPVLLVPSIWPQGRNGQILIPPAPLTLTAA